MTGLDASEQSHSLRAVTVSANAEVCEDLLSEFAVRSVHLYMRKAALDRTLVKLVPCERLYVTQIQVAVYVHILRVMSPSLIADR